MGICLCRKKRDESPYVESTISRRGTDYNLRSSASSQVALESGSVNGPHLGDPSNSCRHECYKVKSLADTVDKLVCETLDVIGTIIDNEPDPPNSILLLHIITDKPSGWIELVKSLIRVVPVDHPLGPSVIALLLDDSPLPSKDSVLKVSDIMAHYFHRCSQKERNLCVILGCLAEKLAGPSSIAMLNETTLQYLVENLGDNANLHVKLLSLIALEKLAQTSENKTTIKKKLTELDENPLLRLEKYANDDDYLLRQIGFCARWCLDNCFTVEGRKYSYQTVNISKVNAMLNAKDASEYLKISPDGLEARCDAYTFESVRCTFQITSGCWYYEVHIITPGVMQIGWATKNSKFLSHDGYGIGDDKHSIAFDGCRKLIWHNAKSTPHNLPVWKSGSILGCLLNIVKQEVVFSLDGDLTEPYKHIFNNTGDGFFAAASFMSFQHCRFNFGLESFKYPPPIPFSNLNNIAILKTNEKVILPRHIFLENLRKMSVCDDSCSLCCDKKAEIRLEPCNHRGFCSACIEQVEYCPMCRAKIQLRIVDCTENLANKKNCTQNNNSYFNPVNT